MARWKKTAYWNSNTFCGDGSISIFSAPDDTRAGNVCDNYWRCDRRGWRFTQTGKNRNSQKHDQKFINKSEQEIKSLLKFETNYSINIKNFATWMKKKKELKT